MPLRQAERDRGRAGVQALPGQRLAQRDDLFFQLLADLVRARPRPVMLEGRLDVFARCLRPLLGTDYRRLDSPTRSWSRLVSAWNAWRAPFG
jgi:hypothetical protein